METLFVFLNVQLEISLRIGNLQKLLEIGLFIKRKANKKKQRQKQKQEQKQKQKQNKSQKKKIKIALSLGYPSSYFYNKRYMLL